MRKLWLSLTTLLVAWGCNSSESVDERSDAGQSASLNPNGVEYRNVSFSLDGDSVEITKLAGRTVAVCGEEETSFASDTNPAKGVPVCPDNIDIYPQLDKLTIATTDASGNKQIYNIDLRDEESWPADLKVEETRSGRTVSYKIVHTQKDITANAEILTFFTPIDVTVTFDDQSFYDGVTIEQISSAYLKIAFNNCSACVATPAAPGLPNGFSLEPGKTPGHVLLNTAEASNGSYTINLKVLKELATSAPSAALTLNLKIERRVSPQDLTETNKVHFNPLSTTGEIYAAIAGKRVGTAVLDGNNAALIEVSGPKGTEVTWTNNLTNAEFKTIIDGTGDYDGRGHYVRFDAPENTGGILNISRNAEVHFVGAYEGKGADHGYNKPRVAGSTAVSVELTDKPVVLVLSSYEPINWTVAGQEGVDIEAIIVSGYYSSTVVSKPEGVPVYSSSYENRDATSFPYFYAYKDDSEARYKVNFDQTDNRWECTGTIDTHFTSNWTKALDNILELTGHTVTGAQGSYIGDSFSVGAETRSSKLDKNRECGYCYAGMAGQPTTATCN